MTAESLRYRPVAYSVNEVAPPAVLEIAPTYVLSGGELAAKGDKVEPGFLRCITGKEEKAEIPFSGRYRSGRRRALAEWIASPSQSAYCACDGQPNLAASLRERNRPHVVRFRQERRSALASRTSRLAGDAVHREQVEHQSRCID